MDDDREAFEVAYALYLARQVDRGAAQLIVEAAESGLIGIKQATEALMLGLSLTDRTGVKASKPKAGKWARLVS
jgi:phosphosulfolactate synthase (CoM biosynthesis protein A)